MSVPGEEVGAPRPPRDRWRAVVAAGLAGMALGLGWGIADNPRYSATTTLVAATEAEASDTPAALERLAQLGMSRRVSQLAAGLLGDDVPGADLLADVSVAVDPSGATLLVTARSDQPDFAAAAADGYAEALVQVAERQAAEKGGPELALGAAAALPSAPSDNRSGALWAGIGLLGGLLVGALGALAIRRRAPAADAADRIAPALGGWAAGPIAEPGGALTALGSGLVRLRPGGIAPFREMVDALGLDESGAPRTLAVLAATREESAGPIAAALAAASAEVGLRVLVVEADLAAPELAGRFDVAPGPGLGDYLVGDAGPRDVMRSIRVEAGAGDPFTLVCVPGGERGDEADLGGARFAGLVQRLPRAYDLVTFVAPPLLADENAAMVAALVEGVIVVTPPEGLSELEASRCRELLSDARLLGEVVVGT